MENKKPENPPAFPTIGYEITSASTGEQAVSATDNPGMTLRDYFAAKAMAAMIHDYDEDYEECREDIADKSYKIADAMLAERSKQS